MSAAPDTPPLAPTARFQERREAVLAAAVRLFNARGVRGATLADIAREVGLVTNSISYYVRRKEDLARECFLRAIAVCRGVAVQAAEAPDVPTRIRRFYEGHLGLMADQLQGRQPPMMAFNDIRALPEELAVEVFDAYTDMFRTVRGLLKGRETAHLGRDDLNARAHMLLSVAHWSRVWLEDAEAERLPVVAGHVADILVHGLRSPRARWPAAPEAQGATDAALAGLAVADGPQEAFLRAATVLVNEQGYRGASVERISASLNVTKGSFYHHLPNKPDLIAACFERSFGVTREVLGWAEKRGGSGWRRAADAAHALVRFQVSPQGPLLRTTATSALPDEATRSTVLRGMRHLAERLYGLLVDGLIDGSVRALDPLVAAQVTLAAVNAAAELQRWVPSARADTVGALYVRPLFEGLLCPGTGTAGAADAAAH